jgi:translation initiation factor 1A
MLGNCRLDGQCFDGKKRLCHIRGNMRKKVWISVGDIILVSLREFEDDKCDVILKYSSDEARSLKAYGELPDSIKVNEGPDLIDGEGEEDIGFDFDDDFEDI